MYPSRGNNYGQQPYGSQSGYGQNVEAGYSGSSIGGVQGGSQTPLNSRHPSIQGNSQEADFRSRPLTTGHYGGQYSSVYGSASLSATPQALNSKGVGSLGLESGASYASVLPDSPKFASGSYVPSSDHAYGRKGDDIYAEKYIPSERRQFGERHGSYIERDLHSETIGRYSDSSGFGHQLQNDLYDHIDHGPLRGEQLLKVQSLHMSSLDGSSRQPDYLAARNSSPHLSTQEALRFGGRPDSDPRRLSMLSTSSYPGQHAPSILGAAPRRDLDDLIRSESSLNPGYGISLPPGRDYGAAAGKGVRSTSYDFDYPGSSLPDRRFDDYGKGDRASYLRDFELREEERRREILHARDKDRERERKHDREKERERDRERLRKRDHERERDRERQRILDRQAKEREQEHEKERKRTLEIKRERTPIPPRGAVSRDSRSSSLRRDTHREVPHRRSSPVKQLRRDYICKVSDTERDYLSIEKRYPRLFVSPEFSKVIVNWPQENLKLSMHTAVSFEHDFIEDSVVDVKEPLTKISADRPVKSGATTVWNAKMILMSGLSRTALEDLSSDKVFEDRAPHICNILKFAVWKKEHSLMAIGGPWDPADGNDPSIDDSSLIQTILRYAKDSIQLDLGSCCHWNRFLEIHYDRVGKDGLVSHKEVTVLFVPNLSECLPSLDAWRAQWLAFRKSLAEKDHQLSLMKKISKEKEEIRDRETNSSKHGEKVAKTVKKRDSGSSSKGNSSSGAKDAAAEAKGDGNKKKTEIKAGDETTKGKSSSDLKKEATEVNDDGNKKKTEIKNGDETSEQAQTSEKKEHSDLNVGKTPGTKKMVKKIVKRIVKKPVNGAKAASKQGEILGQKDAPEGNANSETSGSQEESANSSSKQKLVEKVVEKAYQDEKTGQQNDVKVETGASEAKSDESVDTKKSTVKQKLVKKVVEKASQGETAGQQIDVKVETLTSEAKPNESLAIKKSTIKKKIIKRVAKKKASDLKMDGDNGEKMIEVMDKQEIVQHSKVPIAKKENDSSLLNEAIKTDEGEKVKQDNDSDRRSENKKTDGNGKDDKKGKAKESEKENKERNVKDEARNNSRKEDKEKKKTEEPPRPGFILQTKGSKESKLRSLSISLDSLLDYTQKDIDETTFELSLFAESLFEMIQYQMGSRLLAFLQKLRLTFASRRNQRKRREAEMLQKENEAKSPAKRRKTDKHPKQDKSAKSEPTGQKAADETSNKGAVEHTQAIADTEAASTGDTKEATSNEAASAGNTKETTGDEAATADGTKETTGNEVVLAGTNEVGSNDEDEEDPEEYEEMEDEIAVKGSPKENKEDSTKNEAKPDPVEVADQAEEKEKKEEEHPEGKITAEPTEKVTKPSKEKPKKPEEKSDSPAKETVINKELVQAFRFFDRNQTGYIRVEDLRLIIHSLGKFLSHREVKELVQSAVLESNSERDDRVLYSKLVRMPLS